MLVWRYTVNWTGTTEGTKLNKHMDVETVFPRALGKLLLSLLCLFSKVVISIIPKLFHGTLELCKLFMLLLILSEQLTESSYT